MGIKNKTVSEYKSNKAPVMKRGNTPRNINEAQPTSTRLIYEMATGASPSYGRNNPSYDRNNNSNKATGAPVYDARNSSREVREGGTSYDKGNNFCATGSGSSPYDRPVKGGK